MWNIGLQRLYVGHSFLRGALPQIVHFPSPENKIRSYRHGNRKWKSRVNTQRCDAHQEDDGTGAGQFYPPAFEQHTYGNQPLPDGDEADKASGMLPEPPIDKMLVNANGVFGIHHIGFGLLVGRGVVEPTGPSKQQHKHKPGQAWPFQRSPQKEDTQDIGYRVGDPDSLVFHGFKNLVLRRPSRFWKP